MNFRSFICLFINKLNAGEFGEGAEETDDIDINEVNNNPIYDEILNGVITDLEVYEAIQNLKNNKAPGTDKILNEYLKHSPPFLVKIYSTLC